MLKVEELEDGTMELTWGHDWLELATLFIRGVFEAHEEDHEETALALFMMSLYQGPMPEA